MLLNKKTIMASVRALNPFPWLKRHGVKLLLLATIVLGAYLLYLDAIIQSRFAGNTWQVPAQIFARPMQLALGQDMTMGEIVEELELLGYRKVVNAHRTGEYQVNGQRIKIMRRSFHFPAGYQGEMAVEVRLTDGKVAIIQDLVSEQRFDDFQLEPWLVTRLVSSGREDRMLVDLNEVPAALTDVLVEVEDKDFYQHHGVAPLAIARALMANIAAGRTVQGGSTLTQQLVKNLFLTREKSLVRKAKEALMALIIDARYSKDAILELYLNEVFLGQNGNTGVHGFGLASYFYFDRPLTELNIPEIATLVGIVKGPSYYNPRRYPERAKERRDLVLRILFQRNHIDRDAYERWVNSPVTVASGASLAQGKHPAFMDKVRRELQTILADPDIRQSGVKVFTTLDPVAQRKAESSVTERLAALQASRKIEQLQAAMVVSDIDSGGIRALVGAREVHYQGFNRALDAQRAVGSLIKPAIYLSALEQAGSYHLASPLKDEPIRLKSTQGAMWEPKNADKKFRGQVPLITALSQSLNVPTVSLGMTLGLPTVAESIQRLGVDADIKLFPALTLGAVDLSPLQVNQMYQTIANDGTLLPLHAVQAILSSDNTLMWQYYPAPEPRFDANATYLLNYALHKVTLEGTASAIKDTFPTINMAGKTGTTDDYRDSWFSGFDKYAVITTWVGRDDNQPTGLTGASGALTLFIDYQQQQAPKSLVRRFPEGLGIAHFDVASGRPTQPGCRDSMSVPAILDALPLETEPCLNANQPLPPPEEKKSWWQRIFGDGE